MDPPPEGFEELEKAFRQAAFAFRPIDRDHGNFRHRAPRSVPTTYADIPDSSSSSSSDDDEGGSLPRTAPSRRGATPRAHTPPHQLSRQTSGLPPTPPTMSNSEVTEAPAVPRIIDPVPLFADHVRNALHPQASGLSLPPPDNRSPPTPDSTPEASGDNLPVPRPKLSRYPSSRAESFRTAAETRSEMEYEKEEEAESMEERPVTRDSQGAESVDVRPKTYVPESEGEVERNPSYSASDERSTTDSAPSSPQLRKALDHRTAYQRLRGVIQPGDSLKRPDESLIYGSSTSRVAAMRRARANSVPKAGNAATVDEQGVAGFGVPQEAENEWSRTPADQDAHQILRIVASADIPSSPEKPAQPLRTKTPRRRRTSSTVKAATPKLSSTDVKAAQGSTASLQNGDDSKQPSFDSQPLESSRDFTSFDAPSSPENAAPQPRPLSLRPRRIRPRSVEVKASSDISHERDGNASAKPMTENSRELPGFTPSIDDPSLPDTQPAFAHHHAPESTSLEDNNAIYKLIQQENVKRHSGASFLSDFPSPALGLAMLDRGPSLRHHAKRESLRSAQSPLATFNPRHGRRFSGEESENLHRLRHKSGQVRLLGKDEVPQRVPSAPVGYWPLSVPPGQDATPSRRAVTFGATPQSAPAKGASRHGRTASGDMTRNGALRDLNAEVPRPSTSSGVPPPQSAAWDSLASPRLLRSFARERRLENNPEVRRTSALRDVVNFGDDGEATREREREAAARKEGLGGKTGSLRRKPDMAAMGDELESARKASMRQQGALAKTQSGAPVVAETLRHDSIDPTAMLARTPFRSSLRRKRLDQVPSDAAANSAGYANPARDLETSNRVKEREKAQPAGGLGIDVEMPAQPTCLVEEVVAFSSPPAKNPNTMPDAAVPPKREKLLPFEIQRTIDRRAPLDIISSTTFPRRKEPSRNPDVFVEAGTEKPLDSEVPPPVERRVSLDKASVLSSPRRKSLDVRYLHPTGTPFSTSQFSDRTGTEVEFGEAKGVEIFPHNNESVLVVDQGANGSKKETVGPEEQEESGSGHPEFRAVVEEPDSSPAGKTGRHRPQAINPPTGFDGQDGALPSPLTHPRPAPDPPLIKCIPPTPSAELEPEFGAETNNNTTATTPQPQPKAKSPAPLQRSLSLTQRVRRASASLIHPIAIRFAARPDPIARSATMPPPRDTHLSPMWQPSDFWRRDDDSESDVDEEFYDDEEGYTLPAGGDTSSLGHHEPEDTAVGAADEEKTPFFPRRMSVKMARAWSLRGSRDRVQGAPRHRRTVSEGPKAFENDSQRRAGSWGRMFRRKTPEHFHGEEVSDDRQPQKKAQPTRPPRSKVGLWDEPEVDTVVPAL